MKTTRCRTPETKYPDVIRPVASPPKLQRQIALLSEHLRTTHADALGFLPFNTYPQAIERDRLVCCVENDEPCGIVVWGKRKRRIKLQQTVIAPDSRRLLHATHAIHAIIDHPDCDDAEVMQLRCATDLEALKFWKAIGCRIIYTVRGKLWKGREIATMTLRLKQPRALKRKMIDRLVDLAIERQSL